jgi:DNA-directed RNA polymerase specialized sigma subunit
MLRRREDDSEDTHLSLLHSIHDTEDDDNASSDGTDANANSDDQLEEWDEETTLAEMLGSP